MTTHTRASRLGAFLRSTVGRKVVMGASGLLLVGYIVTHVLANLLVYLGPRWINGYGAFLHSTGPLLWAVRVGLLAAFVVHIATAAQLARASRAARPTPYRKVSPQAASAASRSVGWGGVALFLFLVYHVPQMTVGLWHPAFVPLDDHGNVVRLFDQQQWAIPVYLLALVALGMHLYHGAWSALRSLGASTGDGQPRRGPLALSFALFVAVGFATIPLAVAAGVLRPAAPSVATGASTR
jgi:succinate dehydrogenase / fumarate reductase cytochrome b subunit